MLIEGNNVMKEVKLNRIKLLDIVQENKLKHIEQYIEAVEDYKIAVLKIAKLNFKFAKTGDLSEISKIKSIPKAPESYESSYDKAIRMLELSVEDEILIDSTTFNQLVLDEWSWKQSFSLSGSLYKSLL